MFTGLIEEVGVVASVAGGREGGLRLRLTAPGIGPALKAGDSVAVDGVCLTVVAPSGAEFAVDVIGSTLRRTTLGRLEPGRRVNLERALALGDRLGGHLVRGHVDDVGVVTRIEESDEEFSLEFSMSSRVAEVTVAQGSIAVNGVSLTVVRRIGADRAEVALIPFTRAHTALSDLGIGDAVNLEGDMIGRFVIDYLERRSGSSQPDGQAPSDR